MVRTADQMITIWPLTDPKNVRALNDDCPFVLARYDLYAGQTAIRDAHRQGVDLSGRGPFLIAWSPSTARGQRDKVVLVYDLSDFETQDSFDRIFSFWQQEIIERPSLWRHGMPWSQRVLIFRDFVDTHAETFAKALHIKI